MAALPCVQCGYDLSGLSPKGVCPECGAEVSRTLGAALRGATRGYRWRVRWGAAALLISIELVVGSTILWAVMESAGREFSLGAPAATLGMVLWCPACWLISAGGAPEFDPLFEGVRRIVRVSSLSLVLLAAAMVNTFVVRFDSTWASGITGLLSIFGLGVSWIGVFDLVSLLAGATGDKALRRRAQRATWWPVGVILFLPAALLMSLFIQLIGGLAGLGTEEGGVMALVALVGVFGCDVGSVLMRFWWRLGQRGG